MNLWKVLALAMIGLLIIAAGIRFTYVETHEFPLSEEQKAFAIKAAQNGLKNETGGDNYNVTVQNHGRIIPTPAGDKKVAYVSFTRENTSLAALVDINTGEVVQKSMVEYDGWMKEYRNQKPHGWVHKRLF